MKPLIEKKKKAIELRKKGYSLKEIVSIVHISHSTASVWLQNIQLNKQAKIRLQKRVELGRQNYKIYVDKRRREKEEHLTKIAAQILSNITVNQELCTLLCSIFYWTEGGKRTTTRVVFTNSDPIMVKTFLALFRNSYQINEEKLRALIHIHEYHHEVEIRRFWSGVTGIPLDQFSKSYIKGNSKKRIRENYKGCMVINYHDASIAHELRMIYNMFSEHIIRGVVQW